MVKTKGEKAAPRGSLWNQKPDDPLTKPTIRSLETTMWYHSGMTILVCHPPERENKKIGCGHDRVKENNCHP